MINDEKKEVESTSDKKIVSEINKENIENSSVEIEEKIIYSKYNKFIFKTSNNNSFDKKESLIYNFAKFGIALLLAIFILISLWISTIWQKDTLKGLNINIEAMNAALGGSLLSADEIKLMLAKNILDFQGLSVNSSIIDSIMTIGIISLFTLIPILVFKNGTLLSVISLSLGFVFLIIIMSLFFYIINQQGELIAIGREGNYLSGLEDAASLTRLEEILKRIIEIVGNK